MVTAGAFGLQGNYALQQIGLVSRRKPDPVGHDQVQGLAAVVDVFYAIHQGTSLQGNPVLIRFHAVHRGDSAHGHGQIQGNHVAFFPIPLN
jgi:hypothetical protein